MNFNFFIVLNTVGHFTLFNICSYLYRIHVNNNTRKKKKKTWCQNGEPDPMPHIRRKLTQHVKSSNFYRKKKKIKNIKMFTRKR